MTQEDRIFELEKTLEIVLDLFVDQLDGRVFINVEHVSCDGVVEGLLSLPQPDADSVNVAIATLYTDEEIDE